MVVNKRDVFRSLRRPREANPELVVDPDRMLSHAVTFQRFEAVAWRCTQVVERSRGIEIVQLSPCNLQQIGRKALQRFAEEGCFRRGIAKFWIMVQYVSLHDTYCKRALSVQPLTRNVVMDRSREGFTAGGNVTASAFHALASFPPSR